MTDIHSPSPGDRVKEGLSIEADCSSSAAGSSVSSSSIVLFLSQAANASMEMLISIAKNLNFILSMSKINQDLVTLSAGVQILGQRKKATLLSHKDCQTLISPMIC